MAEINQIKKLREETGAGVMSCKKAIDQAKGDYQKAKQLIKKWGLLKAKEKSEGSANVGYITSYVHQDSRIGVLVELWCQTDFVARNSMFQKLAHEIALQIAAMNPKDLDELLEQQYIRDPSKTIEELINENIAVLKEKIRIGRFCRYEV